MDHAHDQARAIGRRRFLHLTGAGGAGVLVAPTLLAACGSDNSGGSSATTSAGAGTTAKEQRTLNVQLGWIANVENAGEFVADDKGYYTAEALSVTLTPGGPGAILEPTVASGKALIGLSSADTIASANKEGAKLKIVGVTLQKNPSAVMSLAKSPIKTPKELEGKKLGLQQSGDAIYESFFKKAGVDASKVTKVPVQFDPAPLVSGEVDAFASFQTNQPIQLKQQGVETTTFLLADFGYNLFSDCFFVTEATLADAAARDTVVRWLRATRKGWTDAIADPAAGAKIVVTKYGKDLGLDEAAQTSTLQAFVPLIKTPDIESKGLFWMPDDAVALNVETMNSVGITADKSLFTNELLEAI
jgi:ABC-type nitrate/sulfonate/bicarbonate transport system substrate-binding protein